MARFFRTLLGILLLPLCIAVTWATLDGIKKIPSARGIFSLEFLWFLIGFAFWLFLWFVFRRPFRLYVFGHEMTHALWAMLFGARVGKLKVTASGGSVMVSKENILITLAPYFFPFYTLLVLLIRGILSLCVSSVPCPLLWLFLIGFTWSFHLCFTIESLLTSQPDCQQYGYLLSYGFIYLMNVLGVGIWIVCATDVPFRAYTALLVSRTEYVYYMIYLFSVRAYRHFLS